MGHSVLIPTLVLYTIKAHFHSWHVFQFFLGLNEVLVPKLQHISIKRTSFVFYYILLETSVLGILSTLPRDLKHKNG